ncbi:hypothetical protein B0T09DRAFT_389525 [Sordaria sp. MPI-SDFR-AT-0083]|nr:hypothetical protein B0T09DRAFT_389525 [Sordaria sp. MPI-SDFR-AT-0083]
MHISFLVPASALLPGAFGHTIFAQLTAGGKTYPVSHGIRTPSYDGGREMSHRCCGSPQTDVNSKNMACNGPPNPTTPSDKIIDVTAGSTVQAVWRHTLQSGPNDVMDAGHKATNEIIDNKGNQVIKIPKCIANGQDLLRAEMLNITGGTGTASPATYSIPGIYKSNDPGLLIDIYSMKTTSPYVIPGLPLFTCP